jgi:hypothetical protein
MPQISEMHGLGGHWRALCGVLKSFALGSQMGSATKLHKTGELSFVQISDSLVGFNKPANPDVGEHDVLNDDGKMFRERHAKNAKGSD